MGENMQKDLKVLINDLVSQGVDHFRIINCLLKVIESNVNKEDLINISNSLHSLSESIKKNPQAKLEVWIPLDFSNATIKNRTVLSFLKELKIGIWAELSIKDKKLTLMNSYDVWEGEYNSFPISIKIISKEDHFKYKYTIEE